MRLLLGSLLVSMVLGAGVPSIDDLLNLRTARGAEISPDGKYVVYSVSETDWEQDAFVTHLWVAEVSGGRVWQLTRGKKSEGAPAWSPDGQIGRAHV